MKLILFIVLLLILQVFSNTRAENEFESLLKAASNGNLASIKKELKIGANINTKDRDENTLLHFAVINRNLEIVKFLIEEGVEINQKDNIGDTALATASALGDLEIVKYLVDKGAYLDSKNHFGWTPLKWASIEGNLPVINFLIEKNADITPLYSIDKEFLLAAKQGNLIKMKEFILKGASVNAMDEEGMTALLYVSKHANEKKNNFELIKFLIENGADLSDKSPEGKTALLYATSNASMQVVQYLVENKAYIDDTDSEGKTPLMISANGNDSMLIYFLDHGADAHATANDGWTPLFFAAIHPYNEKIVQHLLEKEVDVNHKDKDNDTALINAAAQGHTKIVQLLLQKGAELNHCGEYGKTALHWASERNHLDVVQLLMESGADYKIKTRSYPYQTALEIAKNSGNEKIVDYLKPLEPTKEKLSNWLQYAKSGDLKNLKKLFYKHIQEKDKDGFTALHWACRQGDLEMVKFLLLQEQDVNAKTNYGYTPLLLSAWSGNLEIVKLLVSKGANINAETIDGDTSLEIAEHNLFYDISAYLRLRGAKIKPKKNLSNYENEFNLNVEGNNINELTYQLNSLIYPFSKGIAQN